MVRVHLTNIADTNTALTPARLWNIAPMSRQFPAHGCRLIFNDLGPKSGENSSVPADRVNETGLHHVNL
jgi:hypothetical protein